jgi:hypothetical protein
MKIMQEGLVPLAKRTPSQSKQLRSNQTPGNIQDNRMNSMKRDMSP